MTLTGAAGIRWIASAAACGWARTGWMSSQCSGSRRGCSLSDYRSAFQARYILFHQAAEWVNEQIKPCNNTRKISYSAFLNVFLKFSEDLKIWKFDNFRSQGNMCNIWEIHHCFKYCTSMWCLHSEKVLALYFKTTKEWLWSDYVFSVLQINFRSLV